MSLFFDLSSIPESITNQALEFIYKASRDDAGNDAIWQPHDSVLVRRIIELFTERGLDHLRTVQSEILAFESGKRHNIAAQPATRPGGIVLWSPEEIALVSLYLESLPVADWQIDDHMLAVDYVVQKFLPADSLRSEAEWLASRAVMMGKVQANLSAKQQETLTAKQADKILQNLPPIQESLTARPKRVLDFATARAAENVQEVSDSARHRMKHTIIQHIQDQQTLPEGVPGRSLETKLADQFAVLNRDWRRIAVTEAGEAQTQGYIASLKPGTKVQRSERYASACGFCKKIDKKIATVVAPDAKDKDPDTMVWVGKNNIGRSASPRKRVNGQLIQRDPEEMWWLPAGLAHPHCRGRWLPLPDEEPGDDPEFAEYLRGLLSV